MKTALFGGSFDPVHLGHVAVAGRAREACGLDRVVFLPCARSPLKSGMPCASDSQRLDMLDMALEKLPWAVIDPIDLELPPPSWSWRVAEHYRDRYPQDQLYWLMGMDQWNDLERWGRWQYLAGMVTFIVHDRVEGRAKVHDGAQAVFITGDHPASSSRIRDAYLAGQEPTSGWLDPAVADYIEESGLYRVCR